jgi:hypothetical protein
MDMNWAHVHLILNHIPVIGMVFGILLLFLAIVQKRDELKVLSLQFFVLLALLTIPTYLTGDPTARIVETLPGVTRPYIERHDHAATIALIGMLILGALSLLGLILYYRTKTLARWVITICFVLSLAVGGWLAWTADLGGQILHIEIRPGFKVERPGGSAANPLKGSLPAAR